MDEDAVMESAAAAAAAAAAGPPPQPLLPRRRRSRCEEAVEALERNESSIFHLTKDAIMSNNNKLTISEATALCNALQKNTSVDTFVIDLAACSMLAIPTFIDYIRTSPRLKHVVTDCTCLFPYCSYVVGQSYKAHLDDLLHAIQENSSIQKLHVEADAFALLVSSSSKSISELLAKTTSITTFHVTADAGSIIPTQMERSIYTGLVSNTCTKHLVLETGSGSLDTLLPRLGSLSSSSSSVVLESLKLIHGEPTAGLWKSVSDILFGTSPPARSTIKTLHIHDVSDQDDTTQGRRGFGKILFRLSSCNTTGLETLILQDVSLALSVDEEEEEEASSNSTCTTVSSKNTSLRTLVLDHIRFQLPRDINVLLGNVVGLEELTINSPTIKFQDEPNRPYWAEFIRNNDKLAKLHLIISGLGGSTPKAFMNGVLDGVRTHQSLTQLTITGDHDDAIGKVLKETSSSSLQELHYEQVHMNRMSATLLAQGLCANHSLHVLTFTKCNFDGAHAFSEIIESLLVNKTLKVVTFQDLFIGMSLLGDTVCQSIAQVLQVNKSLVKFTLPNTDLRTPSNTLSVIFGSLKGNTSLKDLTFDQCRFDDAAMIYLGQALESSDISLEKIALPKNTAVFHADNASVKEGTRSFLRSLRCMSSTIKQVHFGDTITELDDECRGLLLVVAKENKNLVILDGCAPVMDKTIAEKAEIEYYLKLNRFGRCFLDSNVPPPSLWPLLLSRMTQKAENAGAVHFFIREYFMRYSYPLRRQKHQHQHEPRGPALKKPRVVEGSAKKKHASVSQDG